MQNNKYPLEEILENINYVPKIINSKDDFLTLICPEHGMYYKSIESILEAEPECPKCQFLHPRRMKGMLTEAIATLEQTAPKESFDNSPALFYRILVEHKRSGLIFQKVGTTTSLENFIEFWNPWKWKDFIIEPIDQIECTVEEAQALETKFQKDNQKLKLNVPNELKFNLNKTYHWDEIWQAKAKTVPVLRNMMLRQNADECTVCGKPVKAPTLDHMHIKKIKGTGFIRNVCCSQCNTFIARSENNAMRHGISTQELPDVLRRIADHLEDQTKIIHPTEVPKRKKVGVREWNRVKKHFFKVWPRKKVMPKKPVYVTEQWLEMKRAVDKYIMDTDLGKEARKKIKNAYRDAS